MENVVGAYLKASKVQGFKKQSQNMTRRQQANIHITYEFKMGSKCVLYIYIIIIFESEKTIAYQRMNMFRKLHLEHS